jgi:signal recognition particle subunit SRP54
MVLAELGGKIAKALKGISGSLTIDEKAIDDMIKEVTNALIASDVSVKLVIPLKKAIKDRLSLDDLPDGINKRQYIKKVVFEELCRLLDPGVEAKKLVKGQPNVVMFVGLQGSGKTTTCTKYALYYQKKGWRTALVCADTFRAGAFDQLKQNATKAKIPFYGSYLEVDPVKLAKDGVEQFKKEKFDLIIVDTSGRHKQEESLFEEMKQVAEATNPDNIIFVMDSSIGQAAHDQATGFKATVKVGSCIITKLDGHARGGGALSAVAATQSPIIFIGTGEHFDELEAFEPKSFVSRLLGLGDIGKLAEKLSELGIDKQTETTKNLKQGVFTMRDLRTQFQNLMNMGPLNQVMGMIPGMSEMMGQVQEKDGQAKIKKYICIIDSLTKEEVDCPNASKLSNLESRMKRIAKGSGRALFDVKEVFENYKKFSKLAENIGNSGLVDMKGTPKDMKNMQKQMPNLMKGMGNIGGMDMNKMMQQMGGMGGLQNMMKQMGGMGGMQDLMGSMGGMGGPTPGPTPKKKK